MNHITPSQEFWLTRAEVADILGYHGKTIYRIGEKLGLRNVAPKGCHPRYKLSNVMAVKEKGAKK